MAQLYIYSLLTLIILPTFYSVSSDYLNDLSDNGVIILNADNSVFNVSFSIMDDVTFELLEELTASLSFSGNLITLVTLDPNSAEIIILDNDGKSIMTFEK